MKTKPPKARVMWAYPGQYKGGLVFVCSGQSAYAQDMPVLVTPCLTRREADTRKKWANLDVDEKAERMTVAFYERFVGKGAWAKTNAHLRTSIRLGMFAILAITGEGP